MRDLKMEEKDVADRKYKIIFINIIRLRKHHYSYF